MKIIKQIVDLDIVPYKFDKVRNSFICACTGGSDSTVFKSMVKIVTALEENEIPYTVFERDVQLLDKRVPGVSRSKP